MATDVALRSGAAIERTFLSVQGRARGEAFFSAGMLAREADGSVPWSDAPSQAARIRSDLTRNLAAVGLALEHVVAADVHLVPSDDVVGEQAAGLAEVLGIERAAVRAFVVAALNRPEYLVEVAVIGDRMTDDVAVHNVDAVVPVGVAGRWAGDVLHLAGHCDGLGPDVDLPTRYEAVLRSVLATLEAAGLGPTDLVQTTTHLLTPPTAEELAAVGDIRRRLLDAELTPAGTMVTVTAIPCPDSGVQLYGTAMRHPR